MLHTTSTMNTNIRRNSCQRKKFTDRIVIYRCDREDGRFLLLFLEDDVPYCPLFHSYDIRYHEYYLIRF